MDRKSSGQIGYSIPHSNISYREDKEQEDFQGEEGLKHYQYFLLTTCKNGT